MKTRIILTVLVCVFATTPLFAQGPPAQSGPHVFRGEGEGWWWGFADFKRGYVALVGVDTATCETGIVDSRWTYQDNFPPSEEGVWVTWVKGNDVPTSVWPLEILDYADFCDYILEFLPIAEGTSDVIQTDNDFEAWKFDHNRKNAFGLSAHGVLTAPDGERMIFNGGYHCVYDATVDESKCKYKIVLN